jgi:uncharacterized Rmd1/YagE family protein
MNSLLHGIIIPAVCVLPSLGYAYKLYKEKKSTRLEFALINVMAVLIIFTLYLAEVTLK